MAVVIESLCVRNGISLHMQQLCSPGCEGGLLFKHNFVMYGPFFNGKYFSICMYITVVCQM